MTMPKGFENKNKDKDKEETHTTTTTTTSTPPTKYIIPTADASPPKRDFDQERREWIRKYYPDINTEGLGSKQLQKLQSRLLQRGASRQQHFAHHHNKQPQQQQKIRRSDGSWFYYSSNTYLMPAEDTGVQDQHQQQGDGYNTDDHDNAANTDDVVGDYEF